MHSCNYCQAVLLTCCGIISTADVQHYIYHSSSFHIIFIIEIVSLFHSTSNCWPYLQIFLTVVIYCSSVSWQMSYKMTKFGFCSFVCLSYSRFVFLHFRCICYFVFWLQLSVAVQLTTCWKDSSLK